MQMAISPMVTYENIQKLLFLRCHTFPLVLNSHQAETSVLIQMYKDAKTMTKDDYMFGKFKLTNSFL